MASGSLFTRILVEVSCAVTAILVGAFVSVTVGVDLLGLPALPIMSVGVLVTFTVLASARVRTFWQHVFCKPRKTD